MLLSKRRAVEGQNERTTTMQRCCLVIKIKGLDLLI